LKKEFNLALKFTLAQSSLFNISCYVMETSTLPLWLCDESYKICTNFI